MTKYLIGAIVVILLGVGAIAVIKLSSTLSMESDVIFVKDARLGHRLRANLTNARVVIPGRPHPLPFLSKSPEYKRRITRRITYFCSTNSMGFRGSEFSPKPQKGTTRITCVGDSITFGHGVGDSECYPSQLEKMLSPRGRFEVINAGVPRYDSETLLLFLKERVLPLYPRVVTICVGVNDTTVLSEHARIELLQLYLPEPRYRLVLGRFRQNLLSMVSMSREAGAEVILMTPPVTSFFPFPDIERFCREIRYVSAKEGVRLVDLARIFRKEEMRDGLVLVNENGVQKLVLNRDGKPTEFLAVSVPPRRKQFVSEEIYDYLDKHDLQQRLAIDGSHPNVQGHRLIAELLAKEVLELLK